MDGCGFRARHLTVAGQRVMAWKNGGGSTREVAIAPSAVAAAGFSWRISVASVAADGPFSVFPGIDRSLWLLRGNGMVLDVAGREVRLERPLQRFDFAGEVPIHARLIDGPNEDLNVMVDRATTAGDARIVTVAPGACWRQGLGAGEHVALLLAGSAQVAGFAAAVGDAVQVRGQQDLEVAVPEAGSAAAPATLLLASFRILATA